MHAFVPNASVCQSIVPLSYGAVALQPTRDAPAVDGGMHDAPHSSFSARHGPRWRVQVKREQVRKGMVLAHRDLRPAASWEFNADISILTHATTIQPRYQAMIHCEIVRQAARVVAMDRERLRSGDRATVRFRFLQHPEYVTPATRFVFREGRTKGIGVVVGTEAEEAKAAAAEAKAAGAKGGAGA